MESQYSTAIASACLLILSSSRRNSPVLNCPKPSQSLLHRTRLETRLYYVTRLDFATMCENKKLDLPGRTKDRDAFTRYQGTVKRRSPLKMRNLPKHL
jgi:hypothetical protein